MSRKAAAFSVHTLFSAASRERCMTRMMRFPIRLKQGKEPSNTAAVLIPFCVVEDTPSLLYTVRAGNLRSHSGQISFPGGKTDKGETPLQTAVRETKEEIGLAPERIRLWGQGLAVPGRNNEIMVTPVVGTISNLKEQDLHINEDEVDEVFTVPIQMLSDKNSQFYTQFSNGFILPVFIVEGYKIWGITAYLTHVFLSSLLPGEVYKNDWMKQKQKLVLPSK